MDLRVLSYDVGQNAKELLRESVTITPRKMIIITQE